MTRRPVRSPGSAPRGRKRERIARAVARRPAVDPFASSITRLGFSLFTLVRMGYAPDAPLFAAHLNQSRHAMGVLADRLPRGAL